MAEAAREAAHRPRYRRIAVEEGFTIPEIAAAAARLAGPDALGRPPAGARRGALMETLADLGAGRIRAMDSDGIALQLLVLSAPGVQIFDAAEGMALARLANDRLAEAVRAAPGRLAGLAALAPQDPAGAAAELERAVGRLGLKGAVINSHTHGAYLDAPRFWPIFEAAQALDVPVYIHPRDPAPGLAGPLDLDGFRIGWGFGIETGTHIIRLIAGGVFDAFPRLRIVIGHLGEGIPYCLERIDNRYLWEYGMTGATRRLKRLPSEYVRDHIVVTTSGMNFRHPLTMAVALLGAEAVLFAADYPFEDVGAAVEAMDALPLTEAQKAMIYHGNARRVFRLDDR